MDTDTKLVISIRSSRGKSTMPVSGMMEKGVQRRKFVGKIQGEPQKRCLSADSSGNRAFKSPGRSGASQHLSTWPFSFVHNINIMLKAPTLRAVDTTRKVS
jgi:hypothetical protein